MPNIDKNSNEIRAAYVRIINEITRISGKLPLNSNGEFYFRNYPSINKKVNELLLLLNDEVKGITIEGIRSEWDLAVEKNNKLAKFAFGSNLDKLPAQFKNKYLSGNAGALRSFIGRKINGLNLSDRVWKNTRQLKKELELTLELGIGKGESAARIARNAKQYLNQPDKLFRRVKDEKGILRLSKAAKAYNPGQGVYRSSYKNALRLSRNENNNAYRNSEFTKRKSQDFVVGVEIKTTPGWTIDVDRGGIICGDLAGKYPANFNFQGWHTNCRCQSTDILKTTKEIDEDTDKILSGGKPSSISTSSNYVKEANKGYKKYIKDNSRKWINWKSKPYFLNEL